MSYLSNQIDALLKEHKMNAADLARRTDLDEPRISRWRKAAQVWISSKDMISLANGFGGKPETHAALLYARLQDECSGPGAKFINIKLDPRQKAHRVLKINGGACQSILPPQSREDLDTITKAAQKDLAVREMIHAIARLCKNKSLTQALLG